MFQRFIFFFFICFSIKVFLLKLLVFCVFFFFFLLLARSTQEKPFCQAESPSTEIIKGRVWLYFQVATVRSNI